MGWFYFGAIVCAIVNSRQRRAGGFSTQAERERAGERVGREKAPKQSVCMCVWFVSRAWVHIHSYVFACDLCAFTLFFPPSLFHVLCLPLANKLLVGWAIHWSVGAGDLADDLMGGVTILGHFVFSRRAAKQAFFTRGPLNRNE